METGHRVTYGRVFGVAVLILIGSGLFEFQEYIGHNVVVYGQPNITCCSYQGVILNSANAPVTSSTSLDFALYDNPTAGNLVYNETQTVTPNSRGFFSVTIGAGVVGSPAGTSTWPPSQNIVLYLALRVGSSGGTAAYQTPRQQLTQGPYTVNRSAGPLLTQGTSAAAACDITTASAVGGFTTPLSYTTSASTSGTAMVTETFTAASPATAGLTSQWQPTVGTATTACNAGLSAGTTTVTGTEPNTLETSAASVGSWPESVGFVVTGLIPSTTYYFGVSVTDSSAGQWVYSKQTISVEDFLSSPTITATAKQTGSTASPCTISASTTGLAADLGGGMTYTTQAAPYGSGELRVTLTLNDKFPTTATGLTSKLTFYYSTSAPTCASAAVTTGGGTVGKQFTVENSATTDPLQVPQTFSVTLLGLTAGTKYYIDVEVTDSSAGSWVYSNPSLSVVEEPNLNGLNDPSNVVYPLSAQTAGCVTTTATTTMAGLKDYYTLTSTSSGTIYGTLTANVLASGTIAAGSTTAVTLAYAAASATALPACAGASSGTTVGNAQTSETVAAVAFSWAVTVQFVITGLTPGKTYWFDLQVTNAGTSYTSTVSNPQLTITDVQVAQDPAPNSIFLAGASPSCSATTGTNLMGGFAVLPTAAVPPIEYQTTSFGSGIVTVDLQAEVATAATTSSTYKWTFAYGTVTDGTANPACAAAATGTAVGNQYTCTDVGASLASTCLESVRVTVTLSHGTEYWFDLQMTNSATGTDTLPQVTITEPAA